MRVDPAYEEELRERLKTPWSKHALNCAKCPGKGCPVWSTVTLDDVEKGRRVLEGCGFVLAPLRHDLAMGFSLGALQATEIVGKQVVGAIGQGVQRLEQLEARRELKVLNP